MAFDAKQYPDLRKLFEALLVDAMKAMARSPKKDSSRPIPELPSTFRAGFKWALMVFGLIQESTTELNDEQFRILCEKMHTLLNVPPPPDSPY